MMAVTMIFEHSENHHHMCVLKTPTTSFYWVAFSECNLVVGGKNAHVFWQTDENHRHLHS